MHHQPYPYFNQNLQANGESLKYKESSPRIDPKNVKVNLDVSQDNVCIKQRSSEEEEIFPNLDMNVKQS